MPFYTNAGDFLSHVARVRGKLCKGGALDFSAAAQLVLNEWTSGKVRHFCLPPPEDAMEQEAEEAGIISVRTEVSFLYHSHSHCDALHLWYF